MPQPIEARILSSRAMCIAGALACFASAIVLTPTGVRSQLTGSAPAVRAARPAVEPALRPVAPTRDAFAPRAPVDDDPPPPAKVSGVAKPLQPSASERLDPRGALATARVSALATGAHPIAIVEIAGTTRTLSIGDALDGSTIAAIERDAVVLKNGRRLTLAPAETQP
jgi:hypothetical protein